MTRKDFITEIASECFQEGFEGMKLSLRYCTNIRIAGEVEKCYVHITYGEVLGFIQLKGGVKIELFITPDGISIDKFYKAEYFLADPGFVQKIRSAILEMSETGKVEV